MTDPVQIMRPYYARTIRGLGTVTAQEAANAFGYGLVIVGVGAAALVYFVWRAVR